MPSSPPLQLETLPDSQTLIPSAFAYSYATQLTINGIIFSLLLVLLIHLLFTAPSHYALARLNFLLQLSGVVVTLIAVAATIGVILKTGSRETDFWPYMMDFIYVDMPPGRWTTVELVMWYAMEACSSGIVQVRLEQLRNPDGGFKSDEGQGS